MNLAKVTFGKQWECLERKTMKSKKNFLEDLQRNLTRKDEDKLLNIGFNWILARQRKKDLAINNWMMVLWKQKIYQMISGQVVGNGIWLSE